MSSVSYFPVIRRQTWNSSGRILDGRASQPRSRSCSPWMPWTWCGQRADNSKIPKKLLIRKKGKNFFLIKKCPEGILEITLVKRAELWNVAAKNSRVSLSSLNQSVVPCPVLSVASWHAYRFKLCKSMIENIEKAKCGGGRDITDKRAKELE